MIAMDQVFSHVSVLLYECIDALSIRPDLTYVDCTTGGGGHSLEIASRLSGEGRLLCFDRDADALKAARERLAPYLDRVTFIHENFDRLGDVLSDLSVKNLGGVLADLGCSSYQFDTPSRGFSYQHDAPLDMRMDATAERDAAYIVNNYSEEELRRILFEYGEERFAPRIAARIVKARAEAPIRTTGELVSLIRAAIPREVKDSGHPAKRSFQAIRIEVNGELQGLREAVDACIDLLSPGGRIVILTFHSLEDRIVKTAFRTAENPCICPPRSPQCVCGRTPYGKILTKHPLVASEDEQRENSRSACCKLRALEKLPAGIGDGKNTYRERRA